MTIAEKLVLLWPDGFTDEQVKVFVKAVEKIQPDAVLKAMDEHFVSGRFKPKPGDIIQRALNGAPSKSLRDLDADERCRQRVEEFDAAAMIWAATVTDWDLESLREQMIAKRSVPDEVAAMWRKKNPRLSPGLLRMVFEYANETGVVR